MTRWERWCLHLAALLTGATGLLYGWLRYFGQRPGEFGLEPNPLQAVLQHLHVLTAPLMVFILGVWVRGHVLPMWRGGRLNGRMSGVFLVSTLVPMVLAGYAVQVVVDPNWRTAFAWIHGMASLVFLVAYGAHLGASLRIPGTAATGRQEASLNPS